MNVFCYFIYIIRCVSTYQHDIFYEAFIFLKDIVHLEKFGISKVLKVFKNNPYIYKLDLSNPYN